MLRSLLPLLFAFALLSLIPACEFDIGGGDVAGGDGASSSSSGASSSSSGASSSSSGASSSSSGASSSSSGASSSSSGASSSSSGGSDTFASLRTQCLDEINRYRATISLPPLEQWRDAESCSDAEAESDAGTGQAHGAFGQCGEFAQNECPGWPSAEAIVSGCLESMWNEGPPTEDPCEGQCFQDHGHYINMSSTRYSRVACGFFETAAGEVWSVQNFQ